MRQLGELKRNAAQQFEEMGVEVVAVFREERQGVNGLKRIKTKTKTDFRLALDTPAKATKAYSNGRKEFDSYVIDKDGVIQGIVDGSVTSRARAEQLLKMVASLKEGKMEEPSKGSGAKGSDKKGSDTKSTGDKMDDKKTNGEKTETSSDTKKIVFGDRFPEVLKVKTTLVKDTQWRFAVTLSSAYDTPQRYADAWRVLDVQGQQLGIRVLGHDHASEQPFTRSGSIQIPSESSIVFVEGRDKANGWSGQRFKVEMPDQ